MKLEASEEVTAEQLAALKLAGYRPIVMLLHEGPRARHICNVGEAMKNIEIAEQQARCSHVRNGSADYCRKCGALMPSKAGRK